MKYTTSLLFYSGFAPETFKYILFLKLAKKSFKIALLYFEIRFLKALVSINYYRNTINCHLITPHVEQNSNCTYAWHIRKYTAFTNFKKNAFLIHM